MNRFQLAVLSVLMLCNSSLAGAQSCPQDALPEPAAGEARAYLEGRYPDGDNPGAAVLIACNGSTVFSYQAGMANIEWGQPITSDTSFRLGSISKPLTAVAILELVERGRIDLDRPISDYVPLLPSYMRPVTVRQLMSHTSGLPDILLTPMLLPLARDWVSESQIIGMQASVPPRAAPGEVFDYSNFNYVLLAALIESITDTRYADYMSEEVFERLGMERSHYDSRRVILAGRAQGYETSPFGQLLHSENIDMSHASAAGALLSSANDLRKWSDLLLSGGLLEPETLSMAWSPQQPAGGEPSAYGLGFNVTEQYGHRVIWHNGLASGFQGALSIYPDLGLTVIVLSNGFHLPNTTETMDRVAAIFLGRQEG